VPSADDSKHLATSVFSGKRSIRPRSDPDCGPSPIMAGWAEPDRPRLISDPPPRAYVRTINAELVATITLSDEIRRLHPADHCSRGVEQAQETWSRA